MVAPKSCEVAGCSGRSHIRGMCQKHHKRWIRYGDVEIVHERGFEASPFCRKGHDKRLTGEGANKTCKECMRQKAVLKRAQRRELLRAIKIERGCASCDYNENGAALHFHHLDRSTKSFNISRTKESGNEESVLAEIEKCIVLCANCHAILTWEEGLSDG